MSKSSKLKVYHYPACSTCKTALKFLNTESIPYDAIDIVQTPPSLQELRQVLTSLQKQGGGLKNLFNTSGLVYKEMGLSQKLASLSEEDALTLLAKNGKLIKRPFVVSPHFSTVGFKADRWSSALQG